MNQINQRLAKLSNWRQGLNAEAVNEYDSLYRSLRRKKGFGLFFVQCSPATGEIISSKIETDLSRKKIDHLRLTEPIDSLYNLVAKFTAQKQLDILFISGLEYSLYGYEKEKFADNSQGKYSYNDRGIPRFLGYLNLQRDRFREDFNISFVFLLPAFGINYFINRAPDFFDWRSGLFEFIPDQASLIDIDFDVIFDATPEQCKLQILELEALARVRDLTIEEQAKLAYKQFLFCIRLEDYQKAIEYLDLVLKLKPDDDEAWNNRGIALGNLGRYEEAVTSYEQALEIKPDKDEAWYNRGVALGNLGRYEEAVTSYEQALEIKPDDDEAWYNRGIALGNLGKDEDAVASYDKALEIKPDNDAAWNNRGNALGNLGKYEEAVTSYEQALEIKPDKDEAWYNIACCFALQNQSKLAIENLQKAIVSNSEYQEMAKTDSDFDNIRDNQQFQSMFEKSPQIDADG